MPDFPRGTITIKGDHYQTFVIGAKRAFFRDAYHYFLKTSWPVALLMLGVGFFVANLFFAFAYWLVGGVQSTGDVSLPDALFFSVQTMATIGYGVMHPVSTAANTLVIVESMFGIVVTALATGLVFAKFGRATARLLFSRQPVICNHQGKRMLMFRVGNLRSNLILEAQIRVVLSRTERDTNGSVFYRLYDLPLVRERSPSLSRTWTVMHEIDSSSLLYNLGPQDLIEQEVEISASVIGTDDVAWQTVHGRHTYYAQEIQFDRRLADVISELSNGDFMIDMRKFHELESQSSAVVTSP